MRRPDGRWVKFGELESGGFKFAISFQVRRQKYHISRTYGFAHFVFGECERGSCLVWGMGAVCWEGGR